jgi:hypothetical protein
MVNDRRPPPCAVRGCAWMERALYRAHDGSWTCLAFWPDPIPADILSGENPHTELHPLQRPDNPFRYFDKGWR